MKIHVDDWIADEKNDSHARKMLALFRRPALEAMRHPPAEKLFCTWDGRRWRVTGASRLGDVWLAEKAGRDIGYDIRVCVSECSAWGDTYKTAP